jgi:hypothetical protein
VTHYTDGQPRRPVVSMDLTEAFTAHRAPVNLAQIAFKELAAAACAGYLPDTARTIAGQTRTVRDELLTDIRSLLGSRRSGNRPDPVNCHTNFMRTSRWPCCRPGRRFRIWQN